MTSHWSYYQTLIAAERPTPVWEPKWPFRSALAGALLDCGNFNCLPFFLYSGTVSFSLFTYKRWSELMSLSCAYYRFLPLTFMGGSWNADRWVTVAELTKCSGPTLSAGWLPVQMEDTLIRCLISFHQPCQISAFRAQNWTQLDVRIANTAGFSILA